MHESSRSTVAGTKIPLLLNSKRGKAIIRDRYLYFLFIPILAYYILFKYGPMYGVIIAFKDFRIADGIWGSTWVGLNHFKSLFSNSNFYTALKNTLLLNVYGLVFGFPVPIIMAILLNEVRNSMYKRTVQSLLYIPHFISWVVLGGIWISLLSPSTGVVNVVLKGLFGMDPVYFLADKFWWPIMFILSGIWQGAGWGTIIYLAAISGINYELYEASIVDGANKWRQIWHITLPGIRSTIAILLVLRMGGMMDIGFEHVFVLQNSAVRSVSEVISTYVYRAGILNTQYSYTTAVGLFQSVVSLVLILGTNRIIKLMGEEGLW